MNTKIKYLVESFFDTEEEIEATIDLPLSEKQRDILKYYDALSHEPETDNLEYMKTVVKPILENILEKYKNELPKGKNKLVVILKPFERYGKEYYACLATERKKTVTDITCDWRGEPIKKKRKATVHYEKISLFPDIAFIVDWESSEHWKKDFLEDIKKYIEFFELTHYKDIRFNIPEFYKL